MQVLDSQAPGFRAATLLTAPRQDLSRKLADVKDWLRSSERLFDGAHSAFSGNHQDSCHDHDGDVSMHSAGIRSFALRLPAAVDWIGFGVWLTCILNRHGGKVLRVKGLLNVAGAAGPIVLQGVQHVMHRPIHLDQWPDEDRSSRIVFIVQHLDPGTIERSLLAFLNAAQRMNNR